MYRFNTFDAELTGRDFNSKASRYGFNGKLKDNEFEGEGDVYDFGARMYDVRLGRYLSIDPEFKKQPEFSPYVGLNDNPLFFIDPTGKIVKPVNADAEKAFIALLESFSTDHSKLMDVFHIEENESKGTYYSRDIKTGEFNSIATPKQFAKRLKNAGIKLDKEKTKQAYSAYLALADKNIIEIEVVKAEKKSTTFADGKNGSGIDQKEDGTLNTNPGLLKFQKDIISNGGVVSKKIVDDLFTTPTKPEDDRYHPDSRGDKSVFFRHDDENISNGGIKGTIIINGTDDTRSSQTGEKVGAALQQKYPQEK